MLRQVLAFVWIIWGWLWVVTTAAAGVGGPPSPSGLRCEYLENPLGIDVRQPRFSWVLEHTERGQKQSAYQVLVATKLELINQDKGDAWDSGKVVSEESTQVAYHGQPLMSGRRYYWKVRYWDKQGSPSPYSQVAHFEMGLLGREDWKGQWIGGSNLLRKEFNLSPKVVRARAYVTALGYYELRLNGEKVGPNVLDPAWTSYWKRVLYTTYDITPQLQPGMNAVGVMLGEGWAVLGSKVGSPEGRAKYYSSPALMLQINIELEGGTQVYVVSDSTWQTAPGPVVSDSVYDGEVYDARLEQPGWDRPGFTAAGWAKAQVMPGSPGILSAQMMPPIRVVDTMVPLSLTNPRPGAYVYDFGQNFSGWVQLRVQGAAGTAVTMRYSELVYPDGNINRENLREAKSRDVYILRGEGTETYEPRFTYHGFRYVEITGFPGTPSLDSVRGKLVHTAVEPTGSFVASNPLLNQIQHIIRWGQRTNLHSIPTDCSQRNERQGWMGDAQVTAEEAMLNFDMAAFYTNFVRDIRDVQAEDGSITDTVPHIWGQRPADPAWGTAYPLICWYMYEQYGDRRILKENYESLKKYVEHLRSKAPDYLLQIGHYGDWVAIEPTPTLFVSACYYYYDVLLLGKMAQILGRSGDAATYGQLARQIKEAINHKYLDAQTGNYANGTQTANAMALFLDLMPEGQQTSRNLQNDIVYRHNTHVTTGIIGTKYLFPTLTKLGRSELAYELAAQTSYPSWGYMISRGATTLWELWQEKVGPSMNSHNHPMFGSVGAWFYQALGGINVAADGAGYRKILIQPQMVRDLRSVSATVDTMRGPVSSSWVHDPGVIRLEVTIPVNSEATVVLAKEEPMNSEGVVIREGERVIWQKGQFVAGAAGISGITSERGKYTIQVGSGRYVFELKEE